MYIRSPLVGRRGGRCEASGEWVSAEKTIKYRFVKRWSPKRELTEPSKRRRQATTRDGEWERMREIVMLTPENIVV